MIGLRIDRVKGLFFDSKKVVNATTRAERKVLSRFGAYVRRSARSSIRKRKKVSEPGKPPSSHTGLLKRFIFFAYDPGRKSVVKRGVADLEFAERLEGDALYAASEAFLEALSDFFQKLRRTHVVTAIRREREIVARAVEMTDQAFAGKQFDEHMEKELAAGRHYPLRQWSKVRNYVLEHNELGLPLHRVRRHFVEGQPEKRPDGRPADPPTTTLSVAEWDYLIADPVAHTEPPGKARWRSSYCDLGFWPLLEAKP